MIITNLVREREREKGKRLPHSLRGLFLGGPWRGDLVGISSVHGSNECVFDASASSALDNSGGVDWKLVALTDDRWSTTTCEWWIRSCQALCFPGE